jgi:vacuolar protein sorting-associated protein 35
MRQRQHAERTEGATEGEAPAEGEAAPKSVDWEAVDVVGGCLKMGVAR